MRSSRGSDIAFRQPRQPSLAELRAANLRRRRRMRDALRLTSGRPELRIVASAALDEGEP